MFERFTKPAREAVRAATVRAQGEGAPQVRADHVFVAIAAANGSGAALLRAAGWDGDVDALGARFETAQRRGGLSSADVEALTAIGVDADGLLRKLAEGATPPPRKLRGGHRPFANDAKKALENALRAAIARGDRSLGEEHLLLGLLARPGIVPDELAMIGLTEETLGRAWPRSA